MFDERRDSRRRPVDIFVRCRVPATHSSAVMVDLSSSGCRISAREHLQVGQTVLVKFRGHPEIVGTVMWVKDGLAGLRFLTRLPEDYVEELAGEFGVERTDAA